MPTGGKRAGAGRPKGAATEATKRRAELAQRALERGITPLEVMIENMEFARNQALAARKVEDAKTEVSYRSLAQTAAKDAAPYVHPRLANIEMKSDVKVSLDTSADREIINKFLGVK